MRCTASDGRLLAGLCADVARQDVGRDHARREFHGVDLERETFERMGEALHELHGVGRERDGFEVGESRLQDLVRAGQASRVGRLALVIGRLLEVRGHMVDELLRFLVEARFDRDAERAEEPGLHLFDVLVRQGHDLDAVVVDLRLLEGEIASEDGEAGPFVLLGVLPTGGMPEKAADREEQSDEDLGILCQMAEGDGLQAILLSQ